MKTKIRKQIQARKRKIKKRLARIFHRSIQSGCFLLRWAWEASEFAFIEILGVPPPFPQAESLAFQVVRRST